MQATVCLTLCASSTTRALRASSSSVAITKPRVTTIDAGRRHAERQRRVVPLCRRRVQSMRTTLETMNNAR